MQLIFEFNNIFAKKKLKLKLTPYEIIPIGPEGCIVEMVKDATSIDSLKKVKNQFSLAPNCSRICRRSTIEKFLSTSSSQFTTPLKASSKRPEKTLPILLLPTHCFVISSSLKTVITVIFSFTEMVGLFTSTLASFSPRAQVVA